MGKYSEFEEMLQKRKETLLEILDMRNSNIKNIHSSHLKEDSDLIAASIQGQLDSLIIEKYHLELKEVEKALQKIAQNLYGICEMCDDEIDIERLKIKPHARFCIICRELYEKSQKNKTTAKPKKDKNKKDEGDENET
ncbi:RNA polymerase-binding protein DksA [Helicobacter fennelliae]|uniref:C4-type zinc finger protein, DksA/TraR family n=2 Tax=Helicobacter fennelliae TaxID=215 RepID=T1CPU6_9HELI|nr:RNA polymerase-binding protein DksA [Helicobacter fennelliae]GAD18784.1 C4-type zinc finger protein, DksA/TraR family [Helicobacter fennelliae MRY12-0050]SQB97445.1 DnaK suppressor protein [Helicobacter fennelliae]STP07052.1 DnaK suppressor protein [Helicobacter fennelliae]STQ83401.1 DnaK suppressor protein [Helicobacter fennelliae]